MYSDHNTSDTIKYGLFKGQVIDLVEHTGKGQAKTGSTWLNEGTSEYHKVGHQITEKGTANIIFEAKRYTGKGNHIESKDLAISSSDISLLKSYNPEAAVKLETLKASCYTPVYVEPVKKSTEDLTVAKAKETGISL